MCSKHFYLKTINLIMNKNLILILTFFMVLVVLFCFVPNPKIETIGDFFSKVVTPISIILGIQFGLKKSKRFKN